MNVPDTPPIDEVARQAAALWLDEYVKFGESEATDDLLPPPLYFADDGPGAGKGGMMLYQVCCELDPSLLVDTQSADRTNEEWRDLLVKVEQKPL